MTDSMKRFRVLLNSIEKVKQFVKALEKYDCPIDLQSGRYTIDAKSIMGIFSLDLSKEITMVVDTDSEETLSNIIRDIESFIIIDNTI